MVSARPQEVQSYYWEPTATWLCAVLLVFLQSQSQRATLEKPFPGTAASGTPPPVAGGVKILLDFLSKALTPAVKV